MGSSTYQILTDSEEEIIHLLEDIGIKTIEARLLTAFFRGHEMTSRDLERITDLRQPEVSIGVTGLSKRKWVTVSSLISAQKGRPVKVFNLTRAIDQILDEIRDTIATGHDQQVAILRRIREIIKK